MPPVMTDASPMHSYSGDAMPHHSILQQQQQHSITDLKITIGASIDESRPSPPSTPTPSYNVLVNGWPRTTHETLRTVAETFGPVISVNVIGTESRAFVLFATAEGADRCIAELPQLVVRGSDGRAAKITAFPSERGGAVPSHTLYIRNIPSEVPYNTVINVLRAIVGEISTVRRYDCQNRHAAEKGEPRLHYIEVTFKEIPGHIVREVLCDLPSFPRGDGTEVALTTPLVIKYHEAAPSRSTPSGGLAGSHGPSLPPSQGFTPLPSPYALQHGVPPPSPYLASGTSPIGQADAPQMRSPTPTNIFALPGWAPHPHNMAQPQGNIFASAPPPAHYFEPNAAAPHHHQFHVPPSPHGLLTPGTPTNMLFPLPPPPPTPIYELQHHYQHHRASTTSSQSWGNRTPSAPGSFHIAPNPMQGNNNGGSGGAGGVGGAGGGDLFL